MTSRILHSLLALTALGYLLLAAFAVVGLFTLDVPEAGGDGEFQPTDEFLATGSFVEVEPAALVVMVLLAAPIALIGARLRPHPRWWWALAGVAVGAVVAISVAALPVFDGVDAVLASGIYALGFGGLAVVTATSALGVPSRP